MITFQSKPLSQLFLAIEIYAENIIKDALTPID